MMEKFCTFAKGLMYLSIAAILIAALIGTIAEYL